MSPTNFPFRRFAALSLILLLGGPVACDPSVNRLQITAEQTKVDAARAEHAKLEQELTALRDEFKSLKSFGGPEHQKKLTAAVSLRAEKSELESLKKDLDARLEHFEKEAARHREALTKPRQP